ncbi:hypothetical protein Tco_0546116 [Tanacetum coccineum]
MHYPVELCRVKRTDGAKLQATLTSFNNQENERVEDGAGEHETPAPQAKKGKGKVGIPLDPYMFEMITSSGAVADQIQKKQIHYLIKVIIALRPYDGNMHFFSNTLFIADRS